ncbi:MAG: PSD1 and planctomycete cytochrome C domain-containing protein, partial [Verrucomicrobiales bacterium]
MRITLSFYFLLMSAAGIIGVEAQVSDGQGEKLFALHVKQLISEKCIACHSPEEGKKLKGGLDLTSLETLLAGGDSGEVLIPGSAAQSPLYLATTREDPEFEMPPKESDRLDDEQLSSLRDWIDSGAPWPSAERVAALREQFAEGEIVPTSGGLGEEWTNRRYDAKHLWAYRPLGVEEVPDGAHPVDWFVDRKLAEVGIAPAPDAEPRQLARRLSFNLTGLPPAPDEVQRFVEGYAADPGAATSRYARTLMASPHYGEHFARQWLDVARYADSAGFANDYARPNAWRYRDYVVRAFNDDKPYQEFVREQLAGDEVDAGDPERLIATGFLRMGPWEQTSMSVFRVTRQQWIDDITDSVGQTFLAHSLLCAKCHDHKFDPVPTRDYYSMAAIFSTTQFAERDAAFLASENRTGFAEADRWTKAKIDSYHKQRIALKERVDKQRTGEGGDAKVGDNGLDPGDEASLARMGKNISRHQWELDKTKPIAFGVYSGKTIERKNVSTRTTLPQKPWAKGYLQKDVILTGGDAFSEGAPVQPAPLSAATSLGEMRRPAFPQGQGARRKALAEWIVDQQNPLTARVMVNRVWSWHFGQGLAANPNNFGATGGLPSHPALLDFLADWFMKNGWSVKKLNRLILGSATYRRSSRHPQPAVLDAKDPKRLLYATHLPRRLTAEEMRDAMLAVSGELERGIGGIPCRPDINLEVAMQPRQIMGGTASVYEPDPLPEQRNRRSLYAEKIRGLRDPFAETFNQPGPDKSCERRETSTVAPQALSLFNSQEVQDRALALAARLLEGASTDDKAVIDRGFELALGRGATPEEV